MSRIFTCSSGFVHVEPPNSIRISKTVVQVLLFQCCIVFVCGGASMSEVSGDNFTKTVEDLTPIIEYVQENVVSSFSKKAQEACTAFLGHS
jgi:hypothetical protein